METLEMLFWYGLAITFGTLTKEMWHLKHNQHKYRTKTTTIKQQLYNWLSNRWDDALFSFFFGGLTAFIFHSMDIDLLLTKYAGDMVGVTSEALAGIMALSSDKLMNKFNNKIK